MSDQPPEMRAYFYDPEQARMRQEDFTNAWQALLDTELTMDQLRLLSGLAAQFAADQHVARYFEGQVDAVLRWREAADPDRHAFIPDAEDLDNPYCTAKDKGGTPCGLPPSNRRHQ